MANCGAAYKFIRLPLTVFVSVTVSLRTQQVKWTTSLSICDVKLEGFITTPSSQAILAQRPTSGSAAIAPTLLSILEKLWLDRMSTGTNECVVGPGTGGRRLEGGSAPLITACTPSHYLFSTP